MNPEIRAKIDNTRTCVEERLRKFSRDPMRQGEKNDLRFVGELLWIRVGKIERSCFVMMRQSRKDLRERFAGELARRDRRKIHMRMRKQQAHELFADVTGSADHGDFRILPRHNAQCVFRLVRIATKRCGKRKTGLTGLIGFQKTKIP
jgi:hypothetical protein